MTTPASTTARGAAVGIGTYRGEETDAVDAEVRAALVAGIAGGVRWIDTAINYRSQRSERVVGDAVRQAVAGGVARDQLVLATKAGFVPDSTDGATFQELVRDTILGLGLADQDEVTKSGHCISPRYLRWSVDRSLMNLAVDAIDVLYVHNPEAQHEIADHGSVYDRLARAFAELEDLVAQRKIGAYGVATWNALRVPAAHPEHLDLSHLIALAQKAGGERHHFRFVQAPFNLMETELITVRSQSHEGESRSALHVANALGLRVVASSPLAAGRLRHRAAQAVDFVRSVPGLSAVLVGATHRMHGVEASERNRAAPLAPRAWRELLMSIAAEDPS